MVRVEHVMGMPVCIDVRDAGVPADAIDEAFAWLRTVDAVFSTYKDDSEISRLNRGELARDDASADVRWVLDECERLREETGGYFDARVGADGGVDPSGLVKGWSVDRAGEILDARPARRRSRSTPAATSSRAATRSPSGRGASGSSTRTSVTGSPPSCGRTISPWPRRASTSAASTCSTRTPARRRRASSRSPITGPVLGTADAYATAAFAMGTDGPPWTATLDGYEAMTILADGTVVSTERVPEGLTRTGDRGLPRSRVCARPSEQR